MSEFLDENTKIMFIVFMSIVVLKGANVFIIFNEAI